MNERSSRSHNLHHVAGTASGDRERQENYSGCKVSLIDLAGSEVEVASTYQVLVAAHQRTYEYQSKPVHALKLCVGAASAGPKHALRNLSLLGCWDSLGDSAHNVHCHYVPTSVSAEESLSTLQFATRAMRVQTFATANEGLDGNDREA